MERISTLTLQIRALGSDAENKQPPFALGPALQSVLMEHVDESYAAQLHISTLNPYSQCCFRNDENELIWRITALTSEAMERLVAPASAIKTFRVRNLNESFDVTKTTIESFGTDRLLETLKGDAPSVFKVRFVTPAAFRSKGRYVIIPDARFIFQNLLMRYNQVYAGDSEVDPDTLEYIVEHVAITSYGLRSRYFPRTMGKSDKIPAFMGSLTFRVVGPQSLRGLVAMLLTFGEVAGVGIKTAMGMGGMQLIRHQSTQRGGAIGR